MTIPLSDRANTVLRHAEAEAARLGDEEVTAQHLLRGILIERESIAAGVLESLVIPSRIVSALDFIEGRTERVA